MIRSIFSLTPADTFFFRDGKPFSRGESSTAAGIFPPFPSTVYGALRAAYISEHGFDAFQNGKDGVKRVIGTSNPQSIPNATFRVNGVFVADNANIYLPFPRDILAKKDDHTNTLHYELARLEHKGLFSSAQTAELLCEFAQEKNWEYPEGDFLNEDECKEYLAAGSLPGNRLKKTEFLSVEPKIGIGRNSQTLTSEEGLLYQIDMRRLQSGYRLHIEAVGINFRNPHGTFNLGGEKRPFAYNIKQVEPYLDNDDVRQELRQRLEETRKNGKIRFKLYLATPAIWNDGWKSDRQLLQQEKVSCELLTASIGKYQPVGGWDITNKCPKTMYRAVPAGSVYYLQATSPGVTAEQILKTFHYRNLSDVRVEEGFGLTLVGTIGTEDEV